MRHLIRNFGVDWHKADQLRAQAELAYANDDIVQFHRIARKWARTCGCKKERDIAGLVAWKLTRLQTAAGGIR